MAWAIIPAGGCGRRMQSGTAKQYMPLAGRTVIEHAMAPLLRHGEIEGVVVAVAPSDRQWHTLHIATDKPIVTVDAGAERAVSVLSGLDHLHGRVDGATWVLVHDAVRPCLRDDDLDRLISTLRDHAVGGLLAHPAYDTLKRSVDQHVTETLDRSAVWYAQTPQMFRLSALHAALSSAVRAGWTVTDESSAIEWQGLAPRLVAGRSDNIKITRPADLGLAEYLLAAQAAERGNHPACV